MKVSCEVPCQADQRRAKGFWFLPYSFVQLIRYLFNFIFNGWFSYRNPDADTMKRLQRLQRAQPIVDVEPHATTCKVVFLGDIMLTKSGQAPELGSELKQVLAEADVIVANLEAPLVKSDETMRRGWSLSFQMPDSFLKEIMQVNDKAHWVLSVANNHAFDTSKDSVEDCKGLQSTINLIHKMDGERMHVIGAQLPGNSAIYTHEVAGCKLGFLGWTEVMNSEGKHLRKPVCRETDLSDSVLSTLKAEHEYLVGFVHGNEEQSYYPLKETRDRWVGYMKHFDAIVGHGPHVLHNAEAVDAKPLFHSIGNFCSSVGPSQTKVGLLPELNLTVANGNVSLSEYKVHVIEQGSGCVDLLSDPEQSRYPEIVQRLHKIWPELLV